MGEGDLDGINMINTILKAGRMGEEEHERHE
jgi:hypothetical protein